MRFVAQNVLIVFAKKIAKDTDRPGRANTEDRCSSKGELDLGGSPNRCETGCRRKRNTADQRAVATGVKLPSRVRPSRRVVSGIAVEVPGRSCWTRRLYWVDGGEAADCWVVLACPQVHESGGV